MEDQIEINGVMYEPVKKLAEKIEGLTPVLIRSAESGVHFGLLKREEFTQSGKVVWLTNSRRVHYWSGAASLSQMAVDGIGNPEKSRVSVVVKEIEIVNVIETIKLSDRAFQNLKNQPEWKV